MGNTVFSDDKMNASGKILVWNEKKKTYSQIISNYTIAKNEII